MAKGGKGGVYKESEEEEKAGVERGAKRRKGRQEDEQDTRP